MTKSLPFFKTFSILMLTFSISVFFNVQLLRASEKEVVISEVAKEQAILEQKALEARYNVDHGDPVYVEWEKMPREIFEKGKVRIKLMPYMHKSMDTEYLLTDKEAGYVKTGIVSLDNINKSIGAVEYLRRQDALYRVSAASQKYRERHMAYGSHLFREITFDANMDVVEVVRMFEALPEVELAEPVGIKVRIKPVDVKPLEIQESSQGAKWTPNDPFYPGNQWHYENYGQTVQGQAGVAGWDVNAEAAWDIERGNPSFITAIVDGGVQYNHPDIAANMWPTIGPEGTGTRQDDHGTHVAGTISAVTNNGVGVAGLAGGDGTANSGSKIMSIDLFDGTHGLSVTGMFQYAADNGASISQNSWGYGGPGANYADDRNAIDYFNDNGGGDGLNGGIVIFAAGNDDSGADWYPAYYGYGIEKLGAMAVASHDNRGIRSEFSNYGEWIDITAPGTDVASTASAGAYLFMSGTSMACPHVSGAAALIVANTEGVLSNVELWAILKESVRTDLYTLNPGYIGQLGTGALDAAAALVEAQTYLGGVPTAKNFSAVATSPTSIELTWELNQHNDNVLVAWALESGTIGTPVNGSTYSIGNTIPGGGSVLYYGNAQSFDHTELSMATGYKYRIWSQAAEERQDDQGEWYQQSDYSSGRSATATSDCGVYSPPFAESFEGGSIPICWSQQSEVGSGNWAVNNGAASHGTYSAVFTGAVNSTTRLITPVINLQGYATATLTFSEMRPRVTGNTDELHVEYWNGSTWVNLASFTNANQATFANRSINLTNFTSQYLIGFRAVSKGATTSTRIDNISITASGQVVYADFSGTPRTVEVGETVTFTDASGGGTISSWSWNFGAGAIPATATGQGPHEVTYSTSGFKTASLTVNGTTTETKANYISVLTNPILPPRELDYELNDNNVSLTWLTPLIDESWETYTDFSLSFGNWTQHDLDESGTYDIQDVTFANSGYTGAFILFNPSQTTPQLGGEWLPRTGSKYAACFAAHSAVNNDWIISPAVSIKGGHSLSFWHKSITNQHGLERYRVGISTTGTNPADFTIITGGAYLESPITWTEYTYDLSAYAGQEIHIAINCVSDDAFAFFVDDFKILDGSGKAIFSMFDDAETELPNEEEVEDTSSFTFKKVKKYGQSVVADLSSKSYGGYKVYRNGLEITTVNGEKNLIFSDEGLSPGTYLYSITALYVNPANESAPSNIAEVVIGGGAVTPGDVNPDGVLNVLDVVWLVSHLNGDTPDGFVVEAADVNGDGEVDVADITALINAILEVDSKVPVDSDKGHIHLAESGLVTFESDGTLTAFQFELESAAANLGVSLMLKTDHTLAFNSETGKGVVYSMTNTAIPSGKIELLSIDAVDLNEISWGKVVASNSASQRVDVETSTYTVTSVLSFQDNFSVTVFPNPNTGTFTAKIFLPIDGLVELQLIDMVGRVVSQSPRILQTEGEHLVEFNSSQRLNTGVYILRVNAYDRLGEGLIIRHDEKLLIIN